MVLNDGLELNIQISLKINSVRNKLLILISAIHYPKKKARKRRKNPFDRQIETFNLIQPSN